MARNTENKITQESFDGLRRVNRWLALAYAVQAVAILIVSKRAEVAVTTNYLTPDTVQSTLAGHTVLGLATHQLFTVNVGYVIAAALLLLAFVYVALGTFCRTRYESDLKRSTNLGRWVALGAGFGVVLLAVALLAGAHDFSALITLFVLTFVVHMLWFISEKKNVGRLPYGLGIATGVVVLLAVGFYLVGAGMWGGGHVPVYIIWAFATLVVGLAAVAVNLSMQRRGKGKWANYLYAERVYMIVGLVATSAVAWQLFAGALKP